MWEVTDEGWLRVVSIKTGAAVAAGWDDEIASNCDELESLYRLFPGRDGPVTATWFGGVLEAGYGEDIEKPNPYLCVYPNYRIFRIKSGKITHVDEHDREWWYTQHPSVSRGPWRGFLDSSNQ